jgi:hypothetical protein
MASASNESTMMQWLLQAAFGRGTASALPNSASNDSNIVVGMMFFSFTARHCDIFENRTNNIPMGSHKGQAYLT